MLSGWLWRPGSRGFGSEVRVRAKTLLLPYLPWFAIVSLVYGLELWRRGRDSTGKVEEQLPGGAYAIELYSAFWFITALFVAVVTVRGLEALRLPLWLQLAVGVGLCALVQTYQDIAVNSPFAIAQGLGCVIFVQAGYHARLLTGRSGQRSRWSSRMLWVMAIATLGAGVWITTRPGVGNLNLKFAQFNELVWAVLAGILIGAGLIMAPIYIGGVWSHRISTLAQSGDPAARALRVAGQGLPPLGRRRRGGGRAVDHRAAARAHTVGVGLRLLPAQAAGGVGGGPETGGRGGGPGGLG